MARQKKTTAKRGRPPKNAVAKKRGPGRPRKARDTGEPRMDFGVSAAQELASARYQALHMVLETRKLTPGYGVTPESLIADAEKLRKYLSEGTVSEVTPKAVESALVPEAGPIGSGVLSGTAVGTLHNSASGDLRDEYPREAAE